MKKLFLLLVFTGMIGAASATSISVITKGTVVSFKGDDKKKKDDKKKCDKDKACCKKDAKSGDAKACCKKSGTTATSSAQPAPAEKK